MNFGREKKFNHILNLSSSCTSCSGAPSASRTVGGGPTPASPPRRAGRRRQGRRRSSLNSGRTRRAAGMSSLRNSRGGACWAPCARGHGRGPSNAGKAATGSGVCPAAPRPHPTRGKRRREAACVQQHLVPNGRTAGPAGRRRAPPAAFPRSCRNARTSSFTRPMRWASPGPAESGLRQGQAGGGGAGRGRRTRACHGSLPRGDGATPSR